MVFLEEHHNKAGVVTFDDGKIGYTELVEKIGNEFSVRIEHGWYNLYKSDGSSICSGIIVSKDGSETKVKGRSIVKFVPKKWEGEPPTRP